MLHFLFLLKRSGSSHGEHLQLLQMFFCLVLCYRIQTSGSQSCKQKYVLLHKHIVLGQRNSCFNNPVFLVLCFLRFAQHIRGKKLRQASAVKVSLQSLFRDNSPSCTFSRIQLYKSFTASSHFSV